jgi:UDP:flavonoid glycosyltransferase YjiC (YdhE family)
MLAPEEFFTWDRRANKAVAHLCPAIDEALETGRPVDVRRFPTTYTQDQFTKLAVGLCNDADVNVAVLVTGEDTISLVPLTITFVPRQKSRPKRFFEAPSSEAVPVMI